MELNSLLFDVDGTIAETEETHRQCFNQAFNQAGLSWYWSKQLYGDLLKVTGGKERIRHYIDNYTQTFNKPENLPEYIADLHATKAKYYQQAVTSGGIPLRTGVKRLILEARDVGIHLAIATTTSLNNVIVLLENSLALDSPQWFDVIAAGDAVAKKKPASDIYDYALQQLGKSAHSCLAIEDTENGLQSALNAGIKTVVTVSQYSQKQNFNGATLLVDHLGEPDAPAIAHIGNLNSKSYVDLNLLMQLCRD